jgi:hypothetical protein
MEHKNVQARLQRVKDAEAEQKRSEAAKEAAVQASIAEVAKAQAKMRARVAGGK